MMTERQLKAARAEKSDSTVTKKFESDIKRLETKLQYKNDENENLTKEVAELKRKISRLESDVKKSISSEKFDTTVAELNSRLSESEEKLNLEKYGRSQDKIQMERKIKNLQGHMINIYTGNIPPEMCQMLDTIVRIKLNASPES